MNLLAKHFFDYQSFVNLPHKAIQLHKTPPSQAGINPSAAWAPKSMHLAGKNQSAPAARANRNRVEPRPGGHRHGRPNKLEFRTWGNRHGELHAEKIVPHKDGLMMNLKGDFKHFYEHDEGFGSDGIESAIQHFPTFSQRCVEVGDLEVLTIITFTARSDMVTVTVKAIRGLSHFKCRPLVKIQLFDGGRLVEERNSKAQFASSYNEKEKTQLSIKEQRRPSRRKIASVPLLSKAAEYATAISNFSSPMTRYAEKLTANRRRTSRGIGKIAEAQVPRALQPFRSQFQSQSLRQNIKPNEKLPRFFRSFASLRVQKSRGSQEVFRIVPSIECFAGENLRQPLRVMTNHNGGPATNITSPVTETTHNMPQEESQSDFERVTRHLSSWLPRRSSSPPLSQSTTRFDDDESIYNEDAGEIFTDISESFMIRVPQARLAQCHLLVQIFSHGRLPTPPPPPSSLNLLEGGNNNNTQIHCALTEFLDETDSMPSHINSSNKIIYEKNTCSTRDVASDLTNNATLSCDDQPVSDLHISRSSEYSIPRSTSLIVAKNLVGDCLEMAISEMSALFQRQPHSMGAFSAESVNKMIDQSDNGHHSDSNDFNSKCDIRRSSSVINEEVERKQSFQQYVDPNIHNQIYSFGKLNNETSPQFSSKDSMESADSVLEELENDGGASVLLQCSECSCSFDEEFSQCSSSDVVSIASAGNRHVRGTQIRQKTGSLASSSGGSIEGSNTNDQPRHSKKNVLVGGFVIGTLGSSRGRWHWRQMAQRQGHPVFMWHRMIRPQFKH